MFDWIQRYVWFVLVAFAAFVFGAHLLTVAVYPGCWFDEIEILEMGRFSLFDIHPEWSVNLFVAADGTLKTPAPLFHYLAGALSETLYRSTGGYLCARVIMLMSLPVCSFTLFAWLRQSGFPVLVSLVTALVFLLDPNATVCAHWYRPDLWCMAMVFGGIVLSAPHPSPRLMNGRCLLAGMLLATSVFFWITSVLFLPLVLLSFFRRHECLLPRLAWAAGGGIVASLVILIPLYPYVPDIVNQYLTRSEIASMGSVGPGLIGKILSNSFDFVKIALRSPFVWAMAVVGICLSLKRWVYMVFFVGLVAFMLVTRVYHLRMVYLMPWLFLFVAEALRTGFSASRPLIKRGAGAWAVLSLVAELMVSVILLNYAAWPESAPNPSHAEVLKHSVSVKEPRVYMIDMEHELYYVGRELGWKMYSANPRLAVLDGRHDDFLSGLDAVVITACAPEMSDAERSVLATAGFRRTSAYTRPTQTTVTLKSRIAGFIYALGCPSFEVWTRDPH